jgi:hypothetical protein
MIQGWRSISICKPPKWCVERGEGKGRPEQACLLAAGTLLALLAAAAAFRRILQQQEHQSSKQWTVQSWRSISTRKLLHKTRGGRGGSATAGMSTSSRDAASASCSSCCLSLDNAVAGAAEQQTVAITSLSCGKLQYHSLQNGLPCAALNAACRQHA